MKFLVSGALIFSCAALLGAPELVAKRAPVDGTEQSESGKDWDNMSDAELQQELLESLENACDDMGKLEGELAKASRDKTKVDEQYATLKAMIEKFGSDGATVPEGIKSYFEAHPDKLAELLGMTGDDAKALLDKNDELAKKLGESADKLSDLLKDSDILQDVIKRQGDAENDLTDALDAQGKLGAEAEREIGEALEALYAFRRQGSGEGDPSQPPENQPGEQARPEGEEQGQPGKANQPNSPAPSEYVPGSGTQESDLGEENAINKDLWEVDKRDTTLGKSGTGEADAKELPRYKNLWDQFEKAVAKLGNKPGDAGNK